MKKAVLYAQALNQASLKKDEAGMNIFFDNFVVRLKQKREYKLLPQIVREFKSLRHKSSKGSETTLIVSDAIDADKYKQELASVDAFNIDDILVVEDKTVVGGFIAKNSETMLDRSYKKGLIQMYQRLVK